MRLPCDSINVRERPWASKHQPINYKRCCTDRLNSHGKTGHAAATLECLRVTQSGLSRQSGRLLDGSIEVNMAHRYCIESNAQSPQSRERWRLTRQFSLLTTPARQLSSREGTVPHEPAH